MQNKNWKTKTLLVGAGIGLICGLFVTWMRIRQAESKNQTLHLGEKETAEIGLAVLDFLRKQI